MSSLLETIVEHHLKKLSSPSTLPEEVLQSVRDKAQFFETEVVPRLYPQEAVAAWVSVMGEKHTHTPSEVSSGLRHVDRLVNLDLSPRLLLQKGDDALLYGETEFETLAIELLELQAA
jgi:hypothetical protein